MVCHTPQVGVNDEMGALIFKCKSKFLHLKKEGGKSEWQSKGVGSLLVRKPKDAGAKPFVSFTTESVRMGGGEVTGCW